MVQKGTRLKSPGASLFSSAPAEVGAVVIVLLLPLRALSPLFFGQRYQVGVVRLGAYDAEDIVYREQISGEVAARTRGREVAATWRGWSTPELESGSAGQVGVGVHPSLGACESPVSDGAWLLGAGGRDRGLLAPGRQSPTVRCRLLLRRRHDKAPLPGRKRGSDLVWSQGDSNP